MKESKKNLKNKRLEQNWGVELKLWDKKNKYQKKYLLVNRSFIWITLDTNYFLHTNDLKCMYISMATREDLS